MDRVVQTVRLLSAGELRAIAGRLGMRPTKKLGQNFVIEQGTVRRIAALAAPTPADVVLEVGPGLGSLTLALLAAGARNLIAVEIDPLLAAELPSTLRDRGGEAGARAVVIEADALRLRGTQLPEPPTLLAANLPYNVAVPVVLHLLAELDSLRRGIVMVQAEVADRMCAPPGSRVYGGPSAKLAWFAEAKSAGTVPRSVFWPVPNVDSKLVAFTRRQPPTEEVSRAEVFAVIDAAFGQRRKTLRAALAGWAGSPVNAERILRAASIDPSSRGEQLGIADFARIAAPARPGALSSGPGWRDVPKWHAEHVDSVLVTRVTVRVPAKLNLQLAVGPRRADGYHDLVTVFHAIGLFDEVTVEPLNAPAEQKNKVELAVTGEGAGSVPADGTNLAVRAVAELASHGFDMLAGEEAIGFAAAAMRGVRIQIRKRIPVAAGLAGGSADAAGALVAANELWGGLLGTDQLAEIGARLGSDVPFALLGGTVVGRGRGELLTPALVRPTARYHWVLAFADGELSTPKVYQTFDRLREKNPPDAPELSTRLMTALRTGDPVKVGEALTNDLQPAAISLFPALRKTLTAGRECGALGALVAGSGPTCFFLAANERRAVDLAVGLTGAGVCRSVVRAEGPAPGAELVRPGG